MAEHAAPDGDLEEPADGLFPGVVTGMARGPSEAGQGLIEYALAIFLMVIVIIVSLQVMGPRIGSIFSRMTAIG